MANFYTAVLRPLLFRVEPERAHRLALRVGSALGRVPFIRRAFRKRCQLDDARLYQTIAGIDFATPLGLAAGFDKNGTAVEFLGACGFSHVEIGSVSAFPSAGNPRPRLFRLPQERGIVVHYGVPNHGADAVAARLLRRRCDVPLGINLVKTNDARRPPIDSEVIGDYTRAFSLLQGRGQYVNLNLSCPNSANDRNYFDDIDKVQLLLASLASTGVCVPVFLKLKPTMDREWLERLVALCDRFRFIAGFGINLPPGKPAGLTVNMSREVLEKIPGAVAGRPVENLINTNLALLYQVIGPRSRYRLVAAGGIFTGDDAYRKIRLGASLVQLYTALVYEGPGIARAVSRRLLELLVRDGFARVGDAVGVDIHPHRSAFPPSAMPPEAGTYPDSTCTPGTLPESVP